MTSFISEGPGRYADILLDNWFKRAFKEYGDAPRLMFLFLQALIPERQIASIDYAPEESTNQNPGAKGIRVDVECTDTDGRRFVVEVQRSEQHSFYDRAIFNSTFAIQRQLKTGDGYRFPPVYFVGIMQFTLHPDDDRFLYRYSLAEDSTGEVMTDDLHYIFLEVPKCRNRTEASLIEKVGYALCNMPLFSRRPDGLEGELFDLLFSSAELTNFTPEDKIKYHNDMTTERDIRNQIAFARDKGLEEGMEKGMEKGFEQGAAQRNQEIARAMLAKGYDVQSILELTGIDMSQGTASAS